jgi:hypothetical protein
LVLNQLSRSSNIDRHLKTLDPSTIVIGKNESSGIARNMLCRYFSIKLSPALAPSNQRRESDSPREKIGK